MYARGMTTREKALHKHSTGPVIERVCDKDGNVVSHRSGWTAYVDALGFHADEDGEGRWIFSGEGEGFRFNPVRRRDEVRPAMTGELELPDGPVERYVGGFAIRRDDGSTVWIVLWHSVMHLTESGDVAPGFGNFDAEIDEE